MLKPHKANALHQPASRLRDLFVEKYTLLLSWAVRLTHGDREQAEDLLHEAFVHFTLRQLDLAGVENIDGFLYTVLKYFHRAGLRQAKRDPLNQLSLVEFDSVELALRSSFHEDQIDVQNDLRRICTFLCWRKASTKSASYLILRFFHGYYPEEIVRIARTARNVVDRGILLASSEAKIFLSDPTRLRFMRARTKEQEQDESLSKPEPELRAASVMSAVPTAEFLHALNGIILSSRTDECPPREELLRLYQGAESIQGPAKEGRAATIDRTLLAHLVSCPPCLDAVNHLLQIPPLSDRFPVDRLGRDRRNLDKGRSPVRRTPKGTGSQMNHEEAFQEMLLAKDSILKIAHHRLRECFEHQPKKLFVAVNGEIVANQDVVADHNKQSVRLDHRKTVDFVDVFSEQGIRLAFISVISSPPEGPDTLQQKVELSEGRSLEATLEFTSSGPLIEVVYTDPLLRHSVALSEEDLDENLQLIADPNSPLETLPETAAFKAEPWVSSARKWWSEWVNHRLIPWLDTFRPLVISVLLAMLIAVIAGLYFVHSRRKVQEARTLLAAAAQQESRPVAHGHVVHRVLEFEIASQDSKQASQQGTVDIWKSADNDRLAMRFSAQDGQLLAGVWRAADGSYSIYRDHKLADHSIAPETLHGILTPGDLTDVWMDEPSATGFEELAAKQGSLTVEKSGDDSIVQYRPEQRAAIAGRAHLVRATLTLRGNRRAVGQTLWIESDGGIRRYSYHEVSYEERPEDASDSGVFSPDRNLVKGHASIRRGSALPDDAVLLAHLNLEAFGLLNTVNADSGEWIAVTRTPSQHLSISGVLPSNERLAQVKGALAPLAKNPLVDISLASAEQESRLIASAGHQKARTATITAESYEINARAIPAQERLKAYFSRRGHSGKDLNQQIENFCQEALGHSSHALQQAWTMHTLASSFSPRDWQQMSLNDHKQWIALYLRHSTTLQAEIQAIRQSLDVLSMSATGEAAEASNPTNNNPLPTPSQTSLRALSDQLLEQSSVADRALRSALTASAGSPPDLDALCNQLHASLTRSDRIMREIEHRAQDL